MAYCIIIRGPLAVGKTTVAKSLAERLSADYFSIDQVLVDHNLLQSDGQGISVSSFLHANQLIIPRIKAVMKTGHNAIVDGNFYHLEPIKHLEQQLSDTVYVFTLKADLEICVKRDSLREDVYGIEAATAVFNMVSRFEYGINIDTTDQSPSQTVDAIMDFLPLTK